MLGGTHVCLRKVDAPSILGAMRAHQVDHYCAAPIVHNLLIAAPAELREGIAPNVRGMVAGAAPPASMIEGMAQIGIDITHVYGLTEVYGPASVAVKRASWAAQDLSEQTRLNGRQGVRYPAAGRHDGDGPEVDAGSAGRRHDDGRDHVPRQHRDEGLPEEPGRRPRPRSPAAGSTPATSRCSRPTAT